MSLRIPIAATVVGALVIGGATTGTTLALWHDQAALAQSQVQSGTIGITVNGSTSATLTAVEGLALNDGATAGAAHTISTILKNTGTGKNLRMHMHLDSIAAKNSDGTINADLTAGLEVAASTVLPLNTCPTPAGTFKGLDTYTPTPLTTASLAPDESRKLCVDIRVKGGASTSVGGKTGTLTFTFRGQQVRP